MSTDPEGQIRCKGQLGQDPRLQGGLIEGSRTFPYCLFVRLFVPK